MISRLRGVMPLTCNVFEGLFQGDIWKRCATLMEFYFVDFETDESGT